MVAEERHGAYDREHLVRVGLGVAAGERVGVWVRVGI